jgi:hypothetical protein
MSAGYTKADLEEWDAVVRFHADPFVRYWIPLRGSLRHRLVHFRVRWIDTHNPYYVWQAISACAQNKRELDPWMVEYLSRCAIRVLSENAKYEHDLRKISYDVLDFSAAKPDCNGVLPKHLLRPDGDEDTDIYMAVAGYFAEEIEKGATPKEARERVHQRCLEYRLELNPADIRVNGEPVHIDEHLAVVEGMAAEVERKLYNIDDKTLRINIEMIFGVKKSPRTNIEWKQVIAACCKRLELIDAFLGS